MYNSMTQAVLGKEVQMKIALRVDASIEIGSGHVMRCLTLAKLLRESEHECLFLCREHTGNLLNLINKSGFETKTLPTVELTNKDSEYEFNQNKYERWLGCHWLDDVKVTKEILEEFQPDWLIIDHYGLDNRSEKMLQRHGQKIMVIDDLANRQHECDILLDQNYFREPALRYEKLVPTSCKMLLGPKYVLLRSEFLKARKKVNPRKNTINRVFVSFGGSDSDNMSGLIIDAFSTPNLQHINLDVVVGCNNPHREILKNKILLQQNITLHVQIDYIADLMANSDCAIGASGSTTWERMCLGLPALVIISGDNEKEIAMELESIKLIKLLDLNILNTPSLIQNEIYSFINNDTERNCQSIKVMEMVDGQGTNRVVREIQ